MLVRRVGARKPSDLCDDARVKDVSDGARRSPLEAVVRAGGTSSRDKLLYTVTTYFILYCLQPPAAGS